MKPSCYSLSPLIRCQIPSNEGRTGLETSPHDTATSPLIGQFHLAKSIKRHLLNLIAAELGLPLVNPISVV